jgi:hypothetical protein
VSDKGHADRDEQSLAELGYRQELSRARSSFMNLATSFHHHLGARRDAHDVGQAWNAGGPIAMSIGWPVICVFALRVAVSMSERPRPTPPPATRVSGRQRSAVQAGAGLRSRAPRARLRRQRGAHLRAAARGRMGASLTSPTSATAAADARSCASSAWRSAPANASARSASTAPARRVCCGCSSCAMMSATDGLRLGATRIRHRGSAATAPVARSSRPPLRGRRRSSQDSPAPSPRPELVRCGHRLGHIGDARSSKEQRSLGPRRRAAAAQIRPFRASGARIARRSQSGESGSGAG